jgi:hypothetical protein
MRAINISLVLLGCCYCTIHPATAADNCKICREYHQACVKAHSQAACKSEYDICMKHCQRK